MPSPISENQLQRPVDFWNVGLSPGIRVAVYLPPNLTHLISRSLASGTLNVVLLSRLEDV